MQELLTSAGELWANTLQGFPRQIWALMGLLLYEVDTWLTEVHFCALSATFYYFQHFESDRAIP